MKSFFTLLTRLSLRFRAITLALMVILSVLGVIAVTQLKQELLPSIALPQTIILSQVSGMTSDQVLNVVTKRMETALQTIPEVVNLESTTTGAFGSVITARNNFGENQQKLQQKIQTTLDGVWLPVRSIQPDASQNPQDFSKSLLADVTPDMLIYIAQKDPNFLFQLTPQTWSAFSDDTVHQTLAYLAAQQSKSEKDKSALQQLIEQEIVPQIETLNVVASVSISGGQTLPGDQTAQQPASNSSAGTTSSLLLKLSPGVWQVVAPKAGISGELNNDAVTALQKVQVTIPTTVPALPASWTRDHFSDINDLLEMRTLTRNAAAVFNDFYTSGRIVGPLGQTDDLTPDTIKQMLAIDPTLVNYFKADQLVAMSPDVFAALPDDFIANLDGITRDELAAAALAKSLTGKDAPEPPVDLPSAWKIAPPQLISFSFDDIPLANFSVYSTGAVTPAQADTSTNVAAAPTTSAEATPEPTAAPTTSTDIPQGPALPPIFRLMGVQFNVQIDSADDLINIPVPEQYAKQLGSSTMKAEDFLNFIMLLNHPDQLPAGAQQQVPISINPQQIIGSMSADVVAFLVKYDPTFIPKLQPEVFDDFNDDVLSLPQVTPPLATVWNTLAQRPQFANQPLTNAADLIKLGNGKASTALNTLDKEVPQRFSGYEVRLFDSLTPGTVRYLALQEPDFYKNLDKDVLLKFSPDVLNILPQDFVATLDSDTAKTIAAIASGQQESAAQQLAARYQTNIPAADPTAPALNADWALIGNFLGHEMNSADDFFRFFPDPAVFINSLFDSAQGASFAPNLIGNMSPDAVQYIAKRDPNFLTTLRPEALQLFSQDVVKTLPTDVQDLIKSGGTPFKPTAAVTRTNGNNSFLLTIYKTSGANTVEAYHKVADALQKLDDQDASIGTTVGFEQASFIEESISGVAREGGLGGIFAIIVILAFLSAGVWGRSGRRTTGLIITAIFAVLLIALVLSGLSAAGGSIQLAFDQVDVLVKGLLILGIIAGLLIFLWPGQLPYPAWRSTLVVSVSIPLSLLMALALMNWLPPAVHNILAPAAENSQLLAFVLRLFPESLTINIMTLSGLTVAIGRVVDDSIVVLENIFRQIQEGGDRKTAVISGVRDVSVAIFAATVITVVVFLPLGLTGGIISEFFLPFGLAVTYALLSSFIVAITVVPVLAYLFIGTNEIVEEHQEGALERAYLPALRWALASNRNRVIVLGVAFISLIIGGALFATRPTNFIPGLGEPQITVSVNMPAGTKIVDTNAKTLQLEDFIKTNNTDGDLSKVQTSVGSGGQSLASFIGGGSSVSENLANIVIGVENQKNLDSWTQRIRTEAETIFGKDNVTVSAATLSDQGFGGFSLVLSGPEDDLKAINQKVLDTLNSIPGITNSASDLDQASAAVGSGDNTPVTYTRIDGQSATSYSAELETDNTLGVTSQAVDAIKALPDLPPTVKVSQGFQSDLQTQGFQGLIIAMGIAVIIVVVLLIITFGSVVHWFDIILSIVVAPVGAAVLLTLTNRALGISALIGLLMLIGIVVTNAVVLIDRVQSNRRERKMNVHDALMEAGGRRLRPILMTALATVFALTPLAIGLSKGAIIAAELGTVVIGGLVSSTILTLIIVPVMYSLLAPLHHRLASLVGREKGQAD